jgi:hypothetical protein
MGPGHILGKAAVMEDVEARINAAAYTERETELAEWFQVKPALIRALTELAEEIRETNVANRTNPLVCPTPQAAGRPMD